MNRYVIRTSLVWLLLFAVAAAGYVYRSRMAKHTEPASSTPQPIAAGPVDQQSKDVPLPPASMEALLVPVRLTPEQMNSIGVKTGTVQYKQLNDDIRATGTVEVDERLQSSVQVRFSGYIRKVYANSTYQYVRKGDPLFTIYSPDLVTTQEEYLLARRDQSVLSGSSIDGVASGASSLASAAEQRLRQWDIPESEIRKLKESGTAISELSISAPSSGYIMERNVLPNMYVEPTTKLYTLADLSRVWINAQVFQIDIGRLRRGDSSSIRVDAYPGRVYQGRVEEILPQVDMTTRTVKVRLAVNNSGVLLKPGMFVNVDLRSALGRQLTVPVSAVFQTGIRQIVFVDHGSGTLVPKDLTLGGRVGDDFVVLKGLTAGERIVTSANFLLDSESQLQAAAGSYSPPPPGSGQQATPRSESQSSSLAIDFATDPTPAHKGSNIFRVKLNGVNGRPIVGADVTATFFMAAMPAMGMGAMTTTAQLSAKSSGLYEGTGVLESGGTWQVTVTVKQNGQTIGAKQLRVNAEGGM